MHTPPLPWRRFLLVSLLFVLGLVACGGAVDPGSAGGDGHDGRAAGGGSSSGSKSTRPPTTPPTPDPAPPCGYDTPPPPNDPSCPSTWSDARLVCYAGTPCAKDSPKCWYANAGDGSGSCFAHALLVCFDTQKDASNRYEWRCAQ